ncbi:MAG: M1 family aminopeptidase [Bacteroidales bacterium]|nr:M1 family aminopeptidase [Bacteroidales bacterium]
MQNIAQRVMKIIFFTCFTMAFISFSGHKVYGQQSDSYYPHDDGFKAGIMSKRSIQSPNALLYQYDVIFYHLDIAVERTSVDVEGNVKIKSKVVSSQLDTFAFELVPELNIDSVLIDGTLRNFTRSGDEVFVEIVPPLAQNVVFDAVIYYGGTPQSGGFFSGISNATSPSWGNQITWTLSEPFNAKSWFPVKQVLSDKADSVYIFVTTDASNKVGSNGLLTAIDSLGNNKVCYKWISHYPIAYYLISVTVGEYIDYSFYAHPANFADSILVQNFIYDNPATLPYFKQQIDLTGDFIELYSELFDLYPFWEEKYGHCMAPFSGGMEHQTMTSLGSFSFTLTSHELGHQWFGDYVTCATWNDIWINEGFASYGEYLALEHLDSGSEVQWLADCHNNVKSAQGGSVYVPLTESENVNRIFDSRLSYKKGAAIIHMIRHELQNDSLFFETLKTFLSIYKDSVATGNDFRIVLEDISGKSFVNYFNQWYFGEGYPIFDIVWSTFNDSLYISCNQTTSSSVTPFFNVLLPFHIQTTNGDTLILLQQNQPTEVFALAFPDNITALEFDSENWILKDVNSITQGIKNNDAISAFAMYPNPSSRLINVQFDKPMNRIIEIMDFSGRKLIEKTCSEALSVIDINQLESGVYFIRVLDSEGLQTQRKFIKY